MCGFVGILNKSGQAPDGFVLRQMASTINHRGPDGEGEFAEGPLGLFHKRLAVIDLATGQQPMEYDDCIIVHNGVIYNYIELREELKKLGHCFITASDTEVLLHLYREYGEEFTKKLNGMFAFVIYDRRLNRLFLARDHFGIKPLFWFKDQDYLLFGSEIKAILAFPGIKTEAKIESIYEYLTFQFVMGEQTMFNNIYKILPGHQMTVDISSGSIHHQKYWTPDFSLDPYHTEEYFIVELRKILEETIQQQLRSDVPLGTYLSGGLDSSLITILTSIFLDKPLKSFNGAFNEGPEFSELHYARIVADFSKAELVEVFPTEKEFIELLPKLIYHLDEPVAGPGLFPQYVVSREASKYVKVMLGGQGGDEIFGGYARYLVAYLEQAIKGAINETNEEREHIVSLHSILPNLPALRQYLPMLKSFWKEGAFSPMDQRYFNLLNRMGSTKAYLNPDFVAGINEQQIFEKFSKYFNGHNTLSYFNKMTHFDMHSSLPALLQVEDRVSMAVSIESRVPLLDRRIVDLISHMPAGMKFKGGELKYLLKRAIKDLIPEEIMKRKDKMGFPVPLHIWSKNQAKDFILDVFHSKNAKERNIINTKYVERLIDSERPFGRGLWGLLSLEIWFNQFFDH